MPHNHVYERLVSSPDDAVGAFAYMLYKQHKVAFIKNILEVYSRPPTDEEMEVFCQQSALESQLEGYRARAQALAENFLENGLMEHIARVSLELRESEFNRRFDLIERKLDGRRGFWGWCAQVSANLLVNIVTIIVVGAAVIGYRSLNSLNSSAETSLHLGPTQTQQRQDVMPPSK
jgi:hypothetical protein